MHRAFGARVLAFSTRTNAVGNLSCTFTLASSNAGAGGSVVMTTQRSTAAQFRQLRRQQQHSTVVRGLGDAAFYLDSSSTLYARHRTNVVILQAILRLSAGTKYAAAIKSDTVALASVIVART